MDSLIYILNFILKLFLYAVLGLFILAVVIIGIEKLLQRFGVISPRNSGKSSTLVPVSEWFRVSFVDEEVVLEASPPGKVPWRQAFLWSEVVRVCFKSEGPLASDGLYIFTTHGPESLVIPIEARGGESFWNQLVARGLFPSELAVQAASSQEGRLLCWPALPHES